MDIHQGQTTERNVKSASARVGFDDLAETVSGFMQVLFPAAGGWNFLFTPKEGDQTLVARLPNGAEEGYILGKVYTANKMPQGIKPNIFGMVSDNGKNLFIFDADKGTLDLIVDQDGKLKFKNLDIEVEEHTHIKTKTFHMEVEETAKIDVGTDVSVDVGGNVDTNVKGNVFTGVGGNKTTDVSGNVTEIAGGTHANKGATVLHN
jgi:hypothetical protein